MHAIQWNAFTGAVHLETVRADAFLLGGIKHEIVAQLTARVLALIAPVRTLAIHGVRRVAAGKTPAAIVFHFPRAADRTVAGALRSRKIGVTTAFPADA
jgi:hypothetical protein